MIYLVTNQQQLFESKVYKIISVQESLKIIESWGDIIQFDSETTGRDAHICKMLCAQFGDYEGNDQIVVDTTTIDFLLYKDILENKTLIGVNLAFDDQFCFKYNIIPRKQWDCMVVEQTIFLGYDSKYFHCSFKAIAERRLGIDIDKTTRGEIIWRGLDEKVIIYAAGDVQPLGKIRDSQIEDVKKRNIKVAVDIENKFVVVNAYLMWCGIRLHPEKWKRKIKDNEEKREKALKDLNNWVVDYGLNKWGNNIKPGYYRYKTETNGKSKSIDLPEGKPVWTDTRIVESELGVKDYYVKVTPSSFPYFTINRQGDLFSGFDLTPKCNINWNSNPQVCDFMEMLGFNVVSEDRKSGKIKRSCTEKVISKQKGIADDFLKLYFEYTEKEKDCSTYGENYIDAINPLTGRIHTQFKQIGASSGRMSCGGGSKSKNTDLAKYKKINANRVGYPQIQNLPADEITRGAFVPNEGNLMIDCDYSALESRLGADIYQEKEMLDEFLYRSGDMHSLCASLVFKKELEGIPIEKIKELRPDLRKKVKPIEFSQQFGGGWKAVADSLGCSKEEAQGFVKAYADGFKGITKFKEKGSAFVRSHGYVLICKHTGMKIWWEDFNKWKEFENTPEYVQKYEYTSEERKEHNMAAAKWDRMALNSPTQGENNTLLCINSVNSVNPVMGIPSQVK